MARRCSRIRAPDRAPAHVLEIPELDIFDGIVIATDHGLRFIPADLVDVITRSSIRCKNSMTGKRLSSRHQTVRPVYRVDTLADSGHSMHDVLGRFFGRPHWKREHD